MKEKVLFIDDDRNLLHALRRKLAGSFNVYISDNGQDALQTIDDCGPFSVIVSDYRMPVMDGIEFFSRLRSATPCPIKILLTAYPEMDVALRAINEGRISHFLTKPCPAKKIDNTIQTCLQAYGAKEHGTDAIEKKIDPNLALEGANEGLWDYDVKSRTMRFDNRSSVIAGLRACRIKISLHEYAQLVHPDDRPYLMSAFVDHLENRIDCFEAEYRINNRENETLWICDKGKTVSKDTDGFPLRMAGTRQDITERRTLESKLLQQNKQQMITLFEGVTK